MTTKILNKYNKISTKPLKSSLGINDVVKTLNKGKKLDRLPNRAYELQKQFVDGFISYDINKIRKTKTRLGDKLGQIITLEYKLTPNNIIVIVSKIAIKLDVNNVYSLDKAELWINPITDKVEYKSVDETLSGLITFDGIQYHVLKDNKSNTWYVKDINDDKDLAKRVFDKYKSNS